MMQNRRRRCRARHKIVNPVTPINKGVSLGRELSPAIHQIKRLQALSLTLSCEYKVVSHTLVSPLSSFTTTKQICACSTLNQRCLYTSLALFGAVSQHPLVLTHVQLQHSGALLQQHISPQTTYLCFYNEEHPNLKAKTNQTIGKFHSNQS